TGGGKNDVDRRRQRVRLYDGGRRWHLPAQNQLSLIQDTQRSQTGTFERIEQVRIRLGSVEGGKNLPANHDHHPKPARLLARRNLHGLEQVRRTIPAEVADGAHRAGTHDWRLTRRRSRDEISSVL